MSRLADAVRLLVERITEGIEITFEHDSSTKLPKRIIIRPRK